MRVLRAREYSILPWKNGLGSSRIVASSPDGASYATVDWQVGTTSISANCPFSSLAGFDRQFMLLEGEGVELHCRGANGDPEVRRRIDAPLEPFAFRGDWRTDCALIGAPVRVFNVLTRRGRFASAVATTDHARSGSLEKAADEVLLAFIAGGTLRIDGVSLETDDAMIAAGAALERYAVDGPSARMVTVRLREIRPNAGQRAPADGG